MASCHIMRRLCRSKRWLLWAFLIAASGCGESLEPAPPAGPAHEDTCRIIQRQLPRAAGMSVADFERLLQSPELPALQSFDNQPFSLLLLYADPETVDVAGEAYRQFNTYQRIKPEQVAGVYSESSQHGYVTALQPHRLVTFECQIRDDRATGNAMYELINGIQVAVEFLAQRSGDKWQVQQLELPAWHLRSVRQPNGHWIAEGGIPQRPPVRLVQVQQYLRRIDLGLVRYLVWAGLVDGRPVAWINGQMFPVPLDAEAADVPLTPLVDAMRQMRKSEHKPVGHTVLARLVLRVDRDFPCGALRSLMTAATQVGLKHISLVAEVVPSDEPEEQPPMRWRRNLPIGNLTEFPFDSERSHRQPPVARLPIYVELRADKQGKLARQLLDRNEIESTPALVQAILDELGSGDRKASREIRVYYDNHLRFGQLLPVLAALSRELERAKSVSSEEKTRLHRIEIITEQYGP